MRGSRVLTAVVAAGAVAAATLTGCGVSLMRPEAHMAHSSSESSRPDMRSRPSASVSMLSRLVLRSPSNSTRWPRT